MRLRICMEVQIVLLDFLFISASFPTFEKNKDKSPVSLPWDTSGNQIKEQIKILVLASTE